MSIEAAPTEGEGCLLLFSGGRDSILASCFLIEQGYRVHLVTFDNGATLQSGNVEHTADRLKRMYGDKIEFLGVIVVSGIWREFFLPFMNMKPSAVIEEFGELPVSQFVCLSCRSAMYVWAIMKCKQLGINYIAEGTRKVEGFAIQRPGMLNNFRQFLAEYSIELLLPVYEVSSNWERKNLTLMRNFVPKSLEPQCLVGVPLPDGLPEEVLQAVEMYFEKYILPRAKRMIEMHPKITETAYAGEMI